MLTAGYPLMVWWTVAVYPCPYCLFGTEGGCVGVGWATEAKPIARDRPSVHVQEELLRLGTSYWLPPHGHDLGQQWAVCPVWLLLLAAGVPTALAWRAERRRVRRERVGKCQACGYDLAGLAESAGCPECGRARSAPD